MKSRKSKNERSILYKKWQENHRSAREEEAVSQNMGVCREKIVIKKIPASAKMLEILQEVVFKAAHVIVYICIMLLSSLGLTVLLNRELRVIVIETLTGYLR